MTQYLIGDGRRQGHCLADQLVDCKYSPLIVLASFVKSSCVKDSGSYSADALIPRPGACGEAVSQVTDGNVNPSSSKAFILSMRSQKKRRRKKSGYKVGSCGPPAACSERDSRNIPEWKERAFLLYSTRPLVVAKNAGTCVKSHPILCLQLALSTCETVQELSILPCRRSQLRG